MIQTSSRAAERGDDFLRAAEAADAVQDRHQLFVWLRLHLHRFVPHELALCRVDAPAGSGENGRVLSFHSVPLAAELLDGLQQAGSPFWNALGAEWAAQGRQVLCQSLAARERLDGAALLGLRQAGYGSLLALGLDSGAGVQPEALFVFVMKDDETAAASRAMAALLLPHLYLMALRALRQIEQRQGSLADGLPSTRRTALTSRELQILAAVREAKHNAQIGTLLGITSATVKNHLRKIMRKLGASNRAQAVAEAMKRRLIQ